MEQCEYDQWSMIKNAERMSFSAAPHCSVFDKGPAMGPPFLHNSGNQDSAGFLMGWISASPKWGLDNLTAQHLILPCPIVSVGIVRLSKNLPPAHPMCRDRGVLTQHRCKSRPGFPRKCGALLLRPRPLRARQRSNGSGSVFFVLHSHRLDNQSSIIYYLLVLFLHSCLIVCRKHYVWTSLSKCNPNCFYHLRRDMPPQKWTLSCHFSF